MGLRGGAVALATACIALAAAGCGSDGGGNSAADKDKLKSYEPGTKTVRGVGPDTYTVTKPKKEYSIGVSLPHFKDPYWISLAYGAQKEAKKLGVKIRIQAATGYGDTENQIKQIDNYLTQGVDGLVIGAVDSKGIAPTIDKAWNEGVPVAYATALAESKKTMGVYTDDKLAGTRQADFIAKEDPNAEIIAFCGPPGVVWPKLRCDAFKSQLKKKAPNAKVVTEKFHEMDRAKIGEIAGNTLQAFPKAGWVYNSTDLEAKGVVDALRNKGKGPGDVKITNLTIGSELFDLQKKGWINAALAERPVLQGQLAVRQVVMILEGKKPPANWAVDLPLFEGTKADTDRFTKEEAQYNFSPEGYKP